MPSRWTSWAIILFWTGMMAWLTGSELYHRFATRPRFPETLAASARAGKVHWVITELESAGRPLKEGEAPPERFLGTATTEVRFDARQAKYQLIQDIYLKELFGTGFSLLLNSRADVNVFGRLQGIHFRAQVSELDLHLDLHGVPDGAGKMAVSASLRVAGEQQEFQQQVDYDGSDLVLSSLCPLDRMPGLRPGQTWRTPLLDPVQSLLGQSLPQANASFVELSRPFATVRVWDQPQGLLWRGEYVPCLVVEALHGTRSIKIYVREADGLVLRQTAELGGLSPRILAVTRDPKRAPKDSEPRE
jgi:hypothetical protein